MDNRLFLTPAVEPVVTSLERQLLLVDCFCKESWIALQLEFTVSHLLCTSTTERQNVDSRISALIIEPKSNLPALITFFLVLRVSMIISLYNFMLYRRFNSNSCINIHNTSSQNIFLPYSRVCFYYAISYNVNLLLLRACSKRIFNLMNAFQYLETFILNAAKLGLLC